MPGRQEREFEFELEAPDDWLRLRIITQRGRLVGFLVQYETTIDDERVEIARYDGAHGRPHQDILDRRGNVLQKVWLDAFPPKEVIRVGEADLRANWRSYKRNFLRDRS